MSHGRTLHAFLVATAAVSSSTLASGCVENAIFTLALDLPPAGPDELKYVVVEGRSSTASPDFTTDWQQWQASPIVLTADRTLTSVDFVGSGDIETDMLGVKIRFCFDPHCQELNPGGVDDIDAPQVNIEFARVFYIGEYTRHDETIMMIPLRAVPPTLVMVPKCEVEGPNCRAGSPVNWCTSADPPEHFCEVN